MKLDHHQPLPLHSKVAGQVQHSTTLQGISEVDMAETQTRGSKCHKASIPFERVNPVPEIASKKRI